ncbi:MAG TPA: [protein-PII] uridylyltransferase [Chthoniobacterales bacterium]|jgi:[protein-PII] uridylyltransferase
MPTSASSEASKARAAVATSPPKRISHLEKVLAHAEKKLAVNQAPSSSELLSLYKRFLKIEEHRLRLKHYAGGGGREIARLRVNLIDVILQHLVTCAVDLEKPANVATLPLAVVAIGGYGRGELNPYSDIDILFLRTKGPTPAYVAKIIEKILYLLWDVGFKVGHATRTLAEAYAQANGDMISKTALLESRYLAGDATLYQRFKVEFVTNCVVPFREDYLKWRVENQKERHDKFGGTVFVQEPNVKSGCGGLRDYQNLLWVSYFKAGITSPSELVTQKIIPETDRRQLEKAYDFLLRVRTELHYITQRSSDALTIYLQGQVANKFEYPQKNVIARSEAFMRDYYQHTRTIFRIGELVLAHYVGIQADAPKTRGGLLALLRGKKPAKVEKLDGFLIKEGKLQHESREIFTQDIFRLIRVFQHAQQRNLVLSLELAQLIRRRVRLVDRTFQYARIARETFVAILSRKGEVGRILRMMHETEFLGRYMPEFGALTCLVQHEFFHRYTADEHTLVCIEKLDELIDTTEEKFRDYQALFQKLEDPFVLYLALLLHDTGKANAKRNHAETGAINGARVAARLQLTPDRRRELIFLIDNHMLLSEVAQRRNIEDESTIAEFAGIVKNQTNLDALMLLTLADGQGTSDQGWSDWKESLVWRVYRSTAGFLAEGVAFYEERRTERKTLQASVEKKMARDFGAEVEAHFQFMPERYFQAFEAAEISGHIRFFRELFAEFSKASSDPRLPMVRWIPRPEQGHSEVWICTWDRSDLLWHIAGSFAVVPLNILSADIFTRQDNLVLDVFRVCDTQFNAANNDKDIARVEKTLDQSLTVENFDFTPLIARTRKSKIYPGSHELDFPTRIRVNNDSNPIYSVVEVQCPDRLGLLYDLLRALSDLDINIFNSRITTEKGAAIDTFYVCDAHGGKILERAALNKLIRALTHAVTQNRESNNPAS